MTRDWDRARVQDLLHGRDNWGRWGEDDQVGAVNLITDAKRVEAGPYGPVDLAEPSVPDPAAAGQSAPGGALHDPGAAGHRRHLR